MVIPEWNLLKHLIFIQCENTNNINFIPRRLLFSAQSSFFAVHSSVFQDLLCPFLVHYSSPQLSSSWPSFQAAATIGSARLKTTTGEGRRAISVLNGRGAIRGKGESKARILEPKPLYQTKKEVSKEGELCSLSASQSLKKACYKVFKRGADMQCLKVVLPIYLKKS